ncbi:MAG: DNA topoisomerase VI subunit B [Phycisphaerales bacterium]|nr:DNA topoisomerase VI subunit B [Phycisphaerales bacterium]
MSQGTLLAEPGSATSLASDTVTKKIPRTAPRATAETMAAKQRDISVSEFFAKNRHLLGFDNPRKALLTTVKEAVDNSLDACEEAGILPDLVVAIEDLQPDRPATAKSSRYRVTIVDNGPGIVRKQVENIFGRLLYGSKFHRLKMSRGQQGIGISAAGMYGLITTGKPMVIHTKPSAKAPAHHIELAMNTKTNRAEVTEDTETDDFPPRRISGLSAGTKELAREGQLLAADSFPTGTSVSIELEGRYQKGRGSVDEFLELTAIANPHARFVFVPPSRESAAEEEELLPVKKSRKAEIATKGEDGEVVAAPTPEPAPQPAVTTESNGVTIFPRGVNELPPETKEIQPHPKGIELGILLQMLKDFEAANKGGGTLYNFLQEQFSRISAQTASSFCDKIDVTSRTKVSDIDPPLAEKLFKEFQEARLPPPPTDCLAPIGVRQLLAGMLKGVRAEFYAASSREAEIYRGRPFQIEAAIAFGGELAADDACRVIRFANRVPLLFQQSACSSFKAVADTNWRNYDLQQPRGSAPVGPLVIMIHMASVWVPFTSESKEAIADYDEIRKEMKLALMECGRKLGTYLKKRAKMRRESERRDVFQKYIGEIAKAASAITGVDGKKFYEALLAQAKEKTAIADLQLDEDGKAIRDGDEDPADQDGVIIVEQMPESTGHRALGTGGGGEGIGHQASGIGEGRDRKAKASGRGGRGKSGIDLDADAPELEFSQAESAALKVAAMRDEEDESPARGKKNAAQEARRGSEKARAQAASVGMKSAGAGKPSKLIAGKVAKAAEPAAESKGDAKSGGKAGGKPKPKMRLVNGKLVPVEDGPKLFG